jgi:hypothetical protein
LVWIEAMTDPRGRGPPHWRCGSLARWSDDRSPSLRLPRQRLRTSPCFQCPRICMHPILCVHTTPKVLRWPSTRPLVIRTAPQAPLLFSSPFHRPNVHTLSAARDPCLMLHLLCHPFIYSGRIAAPDFHDQTPRGLVGEWTPLLINGVRVSNYQM